MVRYLFYTIGVLTYQSPLVLLTVKVQFSLYAPCRHEWNCSSGDS